MVALQGGGAKASLFDDATDVKVQLQKKIGGRVMLDEVTLYSDYAQIDVQDSKRKENVDRYVYRGGAVTGPTPVKLSGDYTQADLNAAMFSLDGVDFTLVPKMIEDAKVQLKMPDGKVGLLGLKRGFPFHNDVRWSVHVSNARHTGMVEYDLRAKKKSVSKN